MLSTSFTKSRESSMKNMSRWSNSFNNLDMHFLIKDLKSVFIYIIKTIMGCTYSGRELDRSSKNKSDSKIKKPDSSKIKTW